MTDFDAEYTAKPPQEEGSSGFLKYCLICGCLALLLGGIGIGVFVYKIKQAVIMDPVAVEANLKDTIDCELPDGYAGVFGMNMFGVKMSFIGPAGMTTGGGGAQNVPLMIIAFQLPPGANTGQAKAQMQQALNQQMGQQGNMTVESEQVVTLMVRGQEAEAKEIVGVQNGKKMKQVFMMIDKAADDPSQVMLMFMGEGDTFDQAAMDTFLESIK